MKKYFCVIGLLFALLSCSKGQGKQDATVKYEHLKNKYVSEMLKEIKHYPEEPLYMIYKHYNECLFEVLVNDFLVFQNFRYGGQTVSPTYINYVILKSGPQKLTYRLYPVGKTRNGKYDIPTLTENTEFEIKIRKQDLKIGLKSDTVILEHKAEKKVRMAGHDGNTPIQYFTAAGKMYYEYTLTFYAKVPYELNGWIDGQDLTKFNQEKLQQEVVKFYENQWDILKRKDAEAELAILYTKEKETRQSLYDGKSELEDLFNSHMEFITIPDYKLQPIENYKMEFYGDDRIVTLLQTNVETAYLRGESALWAEYTNERGGVTGDFLKYYLYLPAGKSLSAENFIVIR